LLVFAGVANLLLVLLVNAGASVASSAARFANAAG
jgi:hypothetical protein